jgi:hypothetical protein
MRRPPIKIRATGSQARQVREIARLFDGSKGTGSIAVEWVDLTTGPSIKSLHVRGIDFEEMEKIDPGNIQQIGVTQLEMSTNYYNGVLARARQSFIAAIIGAAIGVGIFAASVLISLHSKNLSAVTVSAIAGGIVEVIAGLNFWLFGKTASQLDSFHVRLDRTQTFLLANSVCTNIKGDSQDAIRGQLVTSMIAGVKSVDSGIAPVTNNSVKPSRGRRTAQETVERPSVN